MFEERIPFANASLRVTLLGDGFGECVVIETAERVAIVDSALGPDGTPLALSYLEAAERSTAEVDLVAATHFDLDHVSGLTDIVRACEPERLVVSGVFRHQELLARMAAERRARESGTKERLPARVTEYFGAIEAAADGALLFATEGTRCRRWEGSTGEVTFEAWAPATSVIDEIHGSIGQLMDKGLHGDPHAMLSRIFRENDTSIVLSVRDSDTHVLLGGDLEATGGATKGWMRAVRIGTENFSDQPIDLVKVPHHGSDGAVDDVMWDRVSPDGIALVAPWVRGGGILPGSTELEALSRRCREVLLTVHPDSLPIGPRGGRKVSSEICWVQATHDGQSWTTRCGKEAARLRR